MSSLTSLIADSWSTRIPKCDSLIPYLLVIGTLCVAFILNSSLSPKPLGHLSGTWSSLYNNYGVLFSVLRMDKLAYIDHLFKQYGPVVRLGPNTVAFNDINAVKSVYSVTSRYSKSSWYKRLQTNGDDHAMTILEHGPHAERRKAYMGYYQLSNLLTFTNTIHDYVFETIRNVAAMEGHKSVDIMTVLRHLMVDVNASAMVGAHIGSISKWAVGVEDPMTTAISDFPKKGVLMGMCLTFLWYLISKLPIARVQKFCESDVFLGKYVEEQVCKARESHCSDGDTSGSEKGQTLIEHMLNYSASSALSDSEIVSEVVGQLIAGTETVSITMSFILWEFSKRPDILKTLQTELDDAMVEPFTLPDYQVLQELPFLNAVVKEGLRLYGAGPSLLERVVSSSTPLIICGQKIPSNTVVGAQSWSLHRIDSVFPSPHRFHPYRWLPEHVTVGMRNHFMPYGCGGRVCGGQAMSSLILRTVIAAFARNFDILANCDETNEKTMKIKDSFVIFPAAMECKLIFRPRQV